MGHQGKTDNRVQSLKNISLRSLTLLSAVVKASLICLLKTSVVTGTEKAFKCYKIIRFQINVILNFLYLSKNLE